MEITPKFKGGNEMSKLSEIKISVGDKYQKGQSILTVVKLTKNNAIVSSTTSKFLQEIILTHLKSCTLYTKIKI